MAKYLLKSSLLKAFLAGAFLFPQLPSHAGVWVVFQSWHETYVSQTGSGFTTDGVTQTLDQALAPSSTSTCSPLWSFGKAEQPNSLTTQAQIKSELHWQPNTDLAGNPDPFDTPPAQVYVLVTAAAKASGSFPSSASFTIAATDGLGDAQVLDEQDGNPFIIQATSNGAKLLALDTHGQTIVPLPIVDTGAILLIPPAPDYPGGRNYLSVGVSVSDQIVSAQISSDIEPSFNKGSILDQTGSLQQPNVRNDDDSMTVDTAVTWVDPNLGGTVKPFWTATCNISATQNAFQNPSYFWSNSGQNVAAYPTGSTNPESLSAIKDASAKLLFQFDAPQDPNNLNQSVNINLSVQDAVGKINGYLFNTYTIRLHLPYENWQKYKADSPSGWQEVAVTPADPGFANYNGSIGLTYEFDPSFWGDVGSAFGTNTFAVLGALPNPYWTGLCAALSLGSASLAPVKANGAADFNNCWNDPDSKFSPPVGTYPPSQYRMTPHMLVGYNYHYMQGDNYDFHGYVGPVRKIVASWDGNQKYIGYFERPDTRGSSDAPPSYEATPTPLRSGVQGVIKH